MPATSFFFFSVFDSQDTLSLLYIDYCLNVAYCKLKVTIWKAKVEPMDKAQSVNLYSLFLASI